MLNTCIKYYFWLVSAFMFNKQEHFFLLVQYSNIEFKKKISNKSDLLKMED